MKRSVAAILLLTAAALAQQERVPYQTAYRNWRAAEPDLERDTSTAGATLGARADKAAAEAAKFYAVRKVYLDSLQADTGRKAAAIESLPAPAGFANPSAYAATQTRLIGASIDAIANDPDRAIQQLRQALERERTALAALSAALADSQNGAQGVERTSTAAEQARGKVTERYRGLSTGLQQTAAQSQQAGTLWADYYRTLSDEARLIPVPDSPPPAPVAPAGPAVSAQAAPAAPLSGAAPVVRNRTITPVPLSRYVGEWIYPAVGAQYHGAQPESADLIVREENGRAKGTLSARFRLSVADPTIRFDFEGALQNARDQTFVLTTSKGIKGTIDLIPGNAFNLLEISFTTEDTQTGVVRQGNFLLLKK